MLLASSEAAIYLSFYLSIVLSIYRSMISVLVPSAVPVPVCNANQVLNSYTLG